MLKLSSRQQQCAELVARGMTNQQVADELGLSHRTVHAHLAMVYAKTGAASRFELWQLFGERMTQGHRAVTEPAQARTSSA